MYYSVGIYPEAAVDLSEAIEAIRTDYDPVAHLIRHHITVLFPVPDRMGKEKCMNHVQTVLGGWSPFDIQLGGFHKSRDHWLFLTLQKGNDEIKQMYREFYSGILAEFRRDDIEFVPHVSLGHFLKPGCTYDWNNPKESDFDSERYEEALRRARELPLPASFTVRTLHVSEILDELLDWTTGRREQPPEDILITQIAEIDLQPRSK
jgi:2'-5' RNA ligase